MPLGEGAKAAKVTDIHGEKTPTVPADAGADKLTFTGFPQYLILQ